MALCMPISQAGPVLQLTPVVLEARWHVVGTVAVYKEFNVAPRNLQWSKLRENLDRSILLIVSNYPEM